MLTDKTALGWTFCLLATCMLCLAGPANAVYLIDAGDVIEVVVTGPAEIRQKVTVQMDGSISLPLLGSFNVAGLQPSEMLSRMQANLLKRPIYRRSSDGAERVIIIGPGDISANVVEYRPIYISGDVGKPGEVSYRPMMTVRQVMAISGVHDGFVVGGNAGNTTIDLRSDYEATRLELNRTLAGIWRATSEITNKTELKPGDFVAESSGGTDGVPADIVLREVELFQAHLLAYRREQDFLRRAISTANEQAKQLASQLEKEEQGTQADVQELDKLNDLFKRGTAPSSRVTDARRAVLLSSTRSLQINVQLAQVRRQQGELGRQLEKLDEERQTKLINELLEFKTREQVLRIKLSTAEAKLARTSSSSRSTTGGNGRMDVVITRKGPNGREQLSANEDTDLLPGDVVEVAFRTEH